MTCLIIKAPPAPRKISVIISEQVNNRARIGVYVTGENKGKSLKTKSNYRLQIGGFVLLLSEKKEKDEIFDFFVI